MTKKIMFLGRPTVIVFSFALALAMLIPVFAQAAYYAPISNNVTLKVGSTGSNVKALQAVLSSDSNIYPSGSKDGIFGSQTRAGVIQFQLAYNLTPDGIVGLNTRTKINSVAASGVGIDVYNMGINGLSVSSSGKNVNIAFSNVESVKAAVFYDTNPLNLNGWNDSIPSLNTPAISGLQSLDNNFSLNKQITLSNTSPNTKYYYTITTTDAFGNTSMVWPSTLTTNQ